MSLDELLRQAQAGDAQARAVYADALLAVGDPRGELIALETAGKPTTRLRQRHAQAWFGLPWHRVKTANGFAIGAAVEAHATIASPEPLSEIEIVNGMPPTMRHIRRLSLQGHVQHLVFLAMVKYMNQLDELWVGGDINSVGGSLDGVQPRVLSLAGARLGHHLHRFIRMDLHRVEELDLRSCELNPYQLGELLAQPLPALRVLKLSGNPLGDRGTALLQQSLRRLPALQHLELIDCGIEDVTGMAITDRADLPAELHLMGCTIEVVPVGRDRHLLRVDGEHRRVRVRTSVSRDGEPATTIDAEPADDAPLAALYDALALGVRRIHTDEGARVWLSREVAMAYTTSYTTTELAELDLTDDVVGISLERHVDAED